MTGSRARRSAIAGRSVATITWGAVVVMVILVAAGCAGYSSTDDVGADGPADGPATDPVPADGAGSDELSMSEVGEAHETAMSEAEWADEIVGVAATVTDAVGLELLPVFLPDEPDAAPDFGQLEVACAELALMAEDMGDLGRRAPEGLEHAGELAVEWEALLSEFAERCVLIAPEEDLEAFEPLGDLMLELAALAGDLQDALPSSAQCPERIAVIVQSCLHDEFSSSGEVSSR